MGPEASEEHKGCEQCKSLRALLALANCDGVIDTITSLRRYRRTMQITYRGHGRVLIDLALEVPDHLAADLIQMIK